jgi:hypothetical protein
MPGDESAIFKGLAGDADKALGDAGGALGDFTEKTAQTADETTDKLLSTESGNTEAFDTIKSQSAPAPVKGDNSALQSKISNILDSKAEASGAGAWKGENGLYLTSEENAAADQFLGRAKDAESNITPVVMDVKNGVPGAEAVGYPDFVLKSPESFKRKLATTLSEGPTRDLDSALADMKDSVRYTLKLPEDGYTDGVNQTISKFHDAGFENVKFKNTWGSDAYKGINSFWRDPQTGHVFEMQFHTQDSFDAKMDTHELYEQARLPGVSPEQVQALQDQQNQIFGAIPRPPGATGIKLPETRK